MQIAPLAVSGLDKQSNTSYDSAQTAAESAKFSQILDELKGRVDKASSAEEAKAVQEAKAAEKRDQELKKACEGFEAMFLNMMYRQMRATVPENTLFGESHALKIFQDMRDDELMKNVAAGGGIGIADMMYKQLKPQVESRNAAQNVIK
ncbi:MAG: rod-binding protein [Selenomonas sp.]|uniref:rod-binding protein n=1 Tax=Selenomonas sp. TaxID=2053611 RepID=UPI0025D77909|nr:rod-binding protein [Selenomonas sp.]MCR5756719.1 rod-binding protein [Selenomonas sp.]